MFQTKKSKYGIKLRVSLLTLFFCLFSAFLISPGFSAQSDLLVEDIKFYSPRSQERPEDEVIPATGQLVTCKAILKNAGDSDTGAFNVKWFVDGIQTGYGGHRGLVSGATSNDNVRFDWTPISGSHTLRFVADADNFILEANENNNAFDKGISVVSAAQVLADLLVEDIKFYSPRSQERPEDEVTPIAGQLVTCKAVLKNIGASGTGVFNVKWFLDGAQAGYGSHSGLAAGSVSGGNVRFDWTPTPGSHTLRFAADVDNFTSEANENNNAFEKGINALPENIPPTGSITINNNIPYTNSSSVTLTLSAQDNPGGSGISQMQFSNDNSNWSTPEAYATTKSWSLSSGDGQKTVYARFKDVSGNWAAPVSKQIVLDTQPPDILIARVNSPTNQPVTLSYTATDNFTSSSEIQVTGDSSPYIREGAYNITLTAKDKANNSSTSSISFTIDTTLLTGNITINNNQTYTNSNVVTLALSAEDGPGGSGLSQMQFSNDNITWSTPENYSTTKSWTLASSDGSKTVYVKFSDKAGNWSAAVSDEIVLDTTPPDILINPVFSPTNQNVTLSYTVTDNLTPTNEIQVTGDNSPYINAGDYNVALNARDLAGNTASSSLTFTIDKTLPVIIITSPTNGAVIEDSPVQLQGTIDGIAFSEERSLSEGENTLTKTTQDLSGNSNTASVTVYLYSGQPIGPEGGEVFSPDGKIKLIIPKNALLQSTRIRILPVNNQSLQGATPQGQTLLTAVEGRPVGLIFYKPTSLIYTLSQAEIPGTQVELGLYDAAENKITSTGQTSAVPVDGYTLTFSINGYSTYAALKDLTPQGIPIGVGVKIPLPDMLTGAASHSIPLTVPPGRKGLQPGLSLSYRSSNPNSWVGLGFSLNPGYIVRSTRLGPPTYIDTQDTFYFISDAGTTELVNLIDNLYQAKVESSFTKFFKEPNDSWRVVGKDGSALRFGQATDAKEGSSLGTFAWYLTRAQDTNSNYISYTYIKDSGKSYLSRIDYTGNEAQGVSPTNSVEFFLESRADVPSSYISSAKIATAKRLKEIQAKVNAQLVWRYELAYSDSPDTQRSLLQSITQYSSDNKALPTQRLSYQKAK